LRSTPDITFSFSLCSLNRSRIAAFDSAFKRNTFFARVLVQSIRVQLKVFGAGPDTNELCGFPESRYGVRDQFHEIKYPNIPFAELLINAMQPHIVEHGCEAIRDWSIVSEHVLNFPATSRHNDATACSYEYSTICSAFSIGKSR